MKLIKIEQLKINYFTYFIHKDKHNHEQLHRNLKQSNNLFLFLIFYFIPPRYKSRFYSFFIFET